MSPLVIFIDVSIVCLNKVIRNGPIFNAHYCESIKVVQNLPWNIIWHIRIRVIQNAPNHTKSDKGI